MNKQKRNRLTKLACLLVVMTAPLALGFDPATVGLLLWSGMEVIAAWSRDNMFVAALLYVLATAVTKTVPFAGGGTAVIFGGFLFGTTWGGILSAAGSTLSATIVALVGRRWFGDIVLDRWGERFAAAEHRLLQNGFSYYLALRVLPVLPAWLVNFVAVIVPLPMRTVILGTFVGILPISCIMAGIGSKVSAVTSKDDDLSWRLLLDPNVLLPLAGLVLLALIPPLLQQLLRRRRASDTKAAKVTT